MLFIEAIRPTLERSGATEILVANSGSDGVELARREQPDLVCLDLGLPDRSGLAVGRDILEASPKAKLVALTALRDDAAVREAMRSGFSAYVTKDTSVPRFLTSLRAVLAGQTVTPTRSTSSTNGARTEQERAIRALAEQLTPREQEVLEMLVDGRSGSGIAKQMGISKNTVRTHIQSILTKLQVHSRLEAAAFAVRHRLVDVPRGRLG